MTRFCLYRDALGPEENAVIFRTAMEQRERFSRSRTVRRGVDLKTRVSTVIYEDQLREVASIIAARVRELLREALPALGIPEFELGPFETQMTSHNDGEFFGRHRDSASPGTAGRTLTYVYYFHGDPKGYTGGELVFHGADGSEQVIEPGNDTLVLFDPATDHEVRPISCPSRRFEDGRFTLNGWVHRRTPPASTFFDQKIFTAVGSWAGVPTRPPASTRATRPTQAVRAGNGGHATKLLALYGDLQRARTYPDRVDVRPDLGAEEFFDRYFCQNRPVVLPGVLGDSTAVGRWSPAWFAEHCGDVEVEITSGRNSSADYEKRYQETLSKVALREFAEAVDSSGESNDIYLVARNYFFENPRLSGLRAELHPPDDIIDNVDRTRGSTKLWMGPAGTVTPLHFDEHSLLFTQVFGRKKFKLIPAFDHPWVYPRDGCYSEVDPENVDLGRHPSFARASVMEAVMEPGDGLFIPAAWWHWARSLSVSISATFSSFAPSFTNPYLGRG